MKTIRKIVFTGGPCGGKTTFASRVFEVFEEHGYRVIIDNESATDLISGGISPATMGMYEFQKYCISLQLHKEKLAYQAAQEIQGDKVLVFIDRGLYDDKSYVSDEEWQQLLKDFDIKEEDVNKRYDMVLHLVTAAKGAVEAYNYSSNSARYDTIEQAIAVDDRTIECWKDHPNRVIIDNSTDFEEKLIRAMREIFKYLGDEKPVETFKKYLVEFDFDVLEKIQSQNNFNHIHILQHYLNSVDNFERRIRQRDKNGDKMYYYSEAQIISTNKRIKTDRVLTERQYLEYKNSINTSLNCIDKDRYTFFYDSHFFKLDVFSFDKSKGLLGIQVPENVDKIVIPDFIKVIKDVSDNSDYKNYYLAKNQKF